MCSNSNFPDFRGISSRQLIEQRLDRETLLRFAYVPFVVAEVVWDYADTIINLAAQMRVSETKKLCRAVRELRRDYDRFRQRYIGSEHRISEAANMEAFEDELSQFFAELSRSVCGEIAEQSLSLGGSYCMLLAAVYQARVTLHALQVYTEEKRMQVAEMLGRMVGDILPPQLRQLAVLLPEFAGDCELLVASRFKKTYGKFTGFLVDRIKSIKLNEI